MNTVPRVFAYLRRYPWLAMGTLGCAVVGAAMVLVFPSVTKRMIDEVLIQHRPERSDLYSHNQMLSLRWFDNRAIGDLMPRGSKLRLKQAIRRES